MISRSHAPSHPRLTATEQDVPICPVSDAGVSARDQLICAPLDAASTRRAKNSRVVQPACDHHSCCGYAESNAEGSRPIVGTTPNKPSRRETGQHRYQDTRGSHLVSAHAFVKAIQAALDVPIARTPLKCSLSAQNCCSAWVCSGPVASTVRRFHEGAHTPYEVRNDHRVKLTYR
jgi:hypothetical protein